MSSYSDAYLSSILTRTRNVAAVGVSAKQIRPSYYVTRYLQLKGYRILPVNPGYVGREILGEPVHGSLKDLPAGADPVQMVDIFRRSAEAGRVVDEALEVLLERGLETVWMQIGVIDADAARRAEAKGVDVVMNRCPKIEHQRLFGELRKGGFNTGIISSRRR